MIIIDQLRDDNLLWFPAEQLVKKRKLTASQLSSSKMFSSQSNVSYHVARWHDCLILKLNTMQFVTPGGNHCRLMANDVQI